MIILVNTNFKSLSNISRKRVLLVQYFQIFMLSLVILYIRAVVKTLQFFFFHETYITIIQKYIIYLQISRCETSAVNLALVNQHACRNNTFLFGITIFLFFTLFFNLMY